MRPVWALHLVLHFPVCPPDSFLAILVICDINLALNYKKRSFQSVKALLLFIQHVSRGDIKNHMKLVKYFYCCAKKISTSFNKAGFSEKDVVSNAFLAFSS